MAEKQKKNGTTLVEVLVAAGILGVVLVGAGAYRYGATLEVRKADIQTTAARVGMTMLETWRTTGGDATYAPEADLSSTDVAVTKLTKGGGPTPPAGYTAMGEYRLNTDLVQYYATLSSKAGVADVTPKALNVRIGWRRDRGTGNLAATDKVLSLTMYMND